MCARLRAVCSAHGAASNTCHACCTRCTPDALPRTAPSCVSVPCTRANARARATPAAESGRGGTVVMRSRARTRCQCRAPSRRRGVARLPDRPLGTPGDAFLHLQHPSAFATATPLQIPGTGAFARTPFRARSCMNPPALALTAVFSCALVGQAVDPDRRDDLRDVVTVARGKPVTGRVANPFHPDELLVLQGGKRVRVARKDVTALDTVTMRLRELLQMHAVVPDEPDRLWILAEWAASRQLHAMAQVFAYRILCIDPEHAESHQLLGHRRRGSAWLWRRGDRFMPRAAFDAYVADIGHPFELRSEHWWIKTDAGVRRAVDALLDLERLYLFFFDRFGNDLDAYEVLRPVPVLVWRNADA